MDGGDSSGERGRTGRFLANALVPLLLLAASCSRETTGESAAAPARRVILISCDTLRADHLGVYGWPDNTSPAVDAFARDAVKFDAAYACSPWTGPSLSSLMTGRLPDEIGVPGGNRFPLPPGAVTLAEIVRDAGIATGAVVSNWVLRRPDPSHGDAGVAQGFQHFDDEMLSREANREKNFERVSPDTTQAAIRWLEEQKRSGSDRFFLWVHYQDPHGPYMPPPDLERKFPPEPTDEPPLTLGTTQKGKGQLPVYQAVDGERDPSFYRARYDAEIRYFDRGFGALIAWLRASGWYDDSLIVFTADHGESLGEHDYWFCHGENVYIEQVHVPLIIHYPREAHRPNGERSGRSDQAAGHTLVSHLDLWPTILEAFALPARPNRGLSLFSWQFPRDRIALHTLGLPGAANRWEGITSDRYRCVIEGQEPPRLYEISDPREIVDLAPRLPERVAELLQRRQAFLASHVAPTLEAQEMAGSEDDEHALKKLGYTDGDTGGDR